MGYGPNYHKVVLIFPWTVGGHVYSPGIKSYVLILPYANKHFFSSYNALVESHAFALSWFKHDTLLSQVYVFDIDRFCFLFVLFMATSVNFDLVISRWIDFDFLTGQIDKTKSTVEMSQKPAQNMFNSQNLLNCFVWKVVSVIVFEFINLLNRQLF